MKRLLPLLLCLLLLPCFALADGSVINLIEHPDAPYAFEEGVPLLEVVYPPLSGADACILRFGDEVMMIDGATRPQAENDVLPTLRMLGIGKVDVALHTHPHDDHIQGFEVLAESIEFGRMLIGRDEDCSWTMINALKVLRAHGIPIERVRDGMTLSLGGAEITLFQRRGPEYTDNDLSVCALVQYGERRLLAIADCENRGQDGLVKNPPACGLEADILKYPHHGHERMDQRLFDMIRPELAVITAAPWFSGNADAYLARQGCPAVHLRLGPTVTDMPATRLRTDGHIWVVDQLPI